MDAVRSIFKYLKYVKIINILFINIYIYSTKEIVLILLIPANKHKRPERLECSVSKLFILQSKQK